MRLQGCLIENGAGIKRRLVKKMGRLKRSCVVGSIVFHTLTLALLFLAPMLLAKREEKVEVIDLIPSEIVDQIMAPPAPVAPPESADSRSNKPLLPS